MLPTRTLQHSVSFYQRKLARLKRGLRTLTDEYAISRQKEEIAVVEVRVGFAKKRLSQATTGS